MTPEKPASLLVLKVTLAVCLLLTALISVNHLLPFFSFFSRLSTDFLGRLGWVTAVLALVITARQGVRQLVVVMLLFFAAGFAVGPYLDPPADPLEHLRRVHEENCGSIAQQIQRENRGLWQYSMAGLLICEQRGPVQPEKMLWKLDVANGLFWALLAGALFVLGKNAGLPGKWAFLSVLICFLYFGSNRFSYFRYYSLAPGASSLSVVWLWTANFFFKRRRIDIVKGVCAAALVTPVIWVNHSQEAVFLGFIMLNWFLLNIAFTWGRGSLLATAEPGERPGIAAKFLTINALGLIFLLALCWLLPQFDFFLQRLSGLFIRDMGQHYQSLSVNWHGFYVSGRIIGLRITDTLGTMAVVMLLVAGPYFWLGTAERTVEAKVRIFLLAVLPFIGYLVPLFHYIWSSHVPVKEYYRLCYMSMFWILFADLLYSIEKKLFRDVAKT